MYAFAGCRIDGDNAGKEDELAAPDTMREGRYL
jgi:hypothetical protein